MYTKKGYENHNAEMSPSKRLRRHLADLATTNTVSYLEAQSLFQDAVTAGAAHCDDLALPNSTRKNIARDFRTKARKGSPWPKPYYAPIRVWNVKKQEVASKLIPFFLPHDILHCLAHEASNSEKLLQTDGLDYDGRLHLQLIQEQSGSSDLCCLGLWGDGVPCNYDRTESCECYCISFPGMLGRGRKARIPVTGLLKKHTLTRDTPDDILEVIAWSLRCCILGVMPSERHDSSPWLPSDAKRKRLLGKPIGCKAALVEVRGDWSFFKSVFSFPGWREKGGCCWRCTAQPQDVRDASAAAPWRTQRYDHFGLLAYLRGYRGHVSTLFGAPYLRADCFRIDWLHCCDLGVASDFLGNLLHVVMSKMPGRSANERCSALFREMQAWYAEHHVQDRFQNLTKTMIQKKPSKPPKLRAKAAEARALVPFGIAATEKWLQEDSPVNEAIKLAARSLSNCYDNLNPELYNPATLRDDCKCFCLQYYALEKVHVGTCFWRVKPKFHLFQELCEMSRNCPSASWTYRDEDFGGTVALYVQRRGGPVEAHSAAQSLLDRFAMRHSSIELLD